MPDHTIPGAWIERHTLAGEWTPFHVVPGQWVGEATATTASAWPAASVEVTAYAPASAFDRASLWPAASIEVTASVPATGITVPSAWPAASVEVTANVPSTSISYASFWPVATTEVTAFAPATSVGTTVNLHAVTHSIWANNQVEEHAGEWVQQGIEESGDTFRMSGRFVVTGVWTASPPLQGDFVYNNVVGTAYHGGAETWGNWDAANITDIMVTPFNFVDTDVASFVSDAGGWIDDVVANAAVTPRVWMYRPWTSYTYHLTANGETFPADNGDAFQDWLDNSNTRPAQDTYFDDCYSGIQTGRGSLTFGLIDVDETLRAALRNTALNELAPSDLFNDAEPHGQEVMYLLAGMIAYMNLFNKQYPTTADLGANMPSQLEDDFEDISAYLWALVSGGSGTASVWPSASTEVTANAPTTAIGVSSAWPSASVEVTAYVPSTGSNVSSNWPAASIEVTAYVPSTGSSVASNWPAATIEVTTNAPASSITVASNWPVASTEITAYVPTTTPPASEPERVEFPGGTGIYGITGYAGSETQFTLAMRLTPRTGWDRFDKPSVGPFELFIDEFGGTANRLSFAVDGNVQSSDILSGGGSPIDTEFSVLFVADGAGISGGGGDTMRMYIDGTLVATDTTTFTAQTVSSFHGFLGGQYDVGPACGIRRIWAAYDVVDDYSAFFNGDDTCVAWTGTGTVNSVTPDFWQEGDATQWNSGSDQNSTSYTAGSTFT